MLFKCNNIKIIKISFFIESTISYFMSIYLLHILEKGKRISNNQNSGKQ